MLFGKVIKAGFRMLCNGEITGNTWILCQLVMQREIKVTIKYIGISVLITPYQLTQVDRAAEL